MPSPNILVNHLLIGSADITQQLLERTRPPFFIIDDGPIADAFLERFPKAKLFDISKHSFNPIAHIDYRRAREFAEVIYTASPQGENTLTVRNGKRALTKLLFDAKRLDKIPRDPKDPASVEANATIDDLLLSPVLKRVLCDAPNFQWKTKRGNLWNVVVKLDRAALGDFDAFVLASLLIGQFQSQVIIPDFGFYGRDYHLSLIRQNRLTAGVRVLSRLSETLQHELLLIPDKRGAACTFDDAQTLARYAGLIPGTTAHTDFIQRVSAAQSA